MSNVEHKRAQRVAQVVQRELAELLTHGLKDPRVGFCTVTEVRVTDDLKSARVFVSILGGTEQRAASLDGLAAAKGFLRREIGLRAELRYVPELAFEADESLDRVERLEALIRGEEPPPEGQPRVAVAVETYRSELLERAKQFETPKKPAGRGQRRRPRR